MNRVTKWLQARVKKTGGWSVKQVRGSFTSPRKMVVTIVIVVAVIAAFDILLGILRSGADLFSFLLSNVIGDALVHLELHQNWFALAGAAFICLIGMLMAVWAVRAIHRYGRPELETHHSARRAQADTLIARRGQARPSLRELELEDEGLDLRS